MNMPTFLGPYRLGELLGRGGMGSVYEAIHEKTGEQVAVKLISPHVSDEMRFRRRFDAEIETLKRLRHDGIVRLIGYGEEDGQLFYSMELVIGEPLQKRIRREKRLDWMTTIDIAIQICAALKHAHDIGVIHRDLKPANLIMATNDQVKLVDFGIAKMFGHGEHTAAGSVLGTADYMAPEQATNSGITIRTDLYALGSVMYAMLAGRPPFKGKKITDVILSLKRDKPIPLEMINPNLPEALTELVHELLEKDPNDRPPTALATMNRLKAMRAGLLRQQTMIGADDVTSHGEVAPAKPQTSVSSLDQEIGSTSKPMAGTSAGTVHGEPAPHDSMTVAVGLQDTCVTDERKRAENQLPSEKPTHFQTVGPAPSESGIFRHEDPEPESKLKNTLSICLLCALLALAGIATVVTMRRLNPPPETLFAQIEEFASVDNLSDARALIEKYLKLYPEGPQIEAVTAMHMTLEIAAIVRRLQVKAKLPGKSLDAHESAFLNAMQLRKQDSDEARHELKLWLDVFDDPNMQDDDDRTKMTRLAKFEIKRLAKQGGVIGTDQRTRELIDRIRTSEALSNEKRRDLLEGIIKLYEDEKWAQPAVKAASEQLANLNAAAPS